MDIHDSTLEVPLKQCSKKEKCANPSGAWQPRTLEFFGEDKRMNDGFTSNCRACRRAYMRDRYETNREKLRQRANELRIQNREQYRETTRRRYELNRDEICEMRRQQYAANPVPIREKNKAFHHRNSVAVNEKRRIRRSQNGELEREKARRRYAANPQPVRDSARKYRVRNPHVFRAAFHRYEARKNSLPATLSASDWLLAQQYFGACAYCGGTSPTYHADHFIPISALNCPGTTPNNIVPACASCNTSKKASDPLLWLIQKFGKDQGEEIYRRIMTYFASLSI